MIMTRKKVKVNGRGAGQRAHKTRSQIAERLRQLALELNSCCRYGKCEAQGIKMDARKVVWNQENHRKNMKYLRGSLQGTQQACECKLHSSLLYQGFPRNIRKEGVGGYSPDHGRWLSEGLRPEYVAKRPPTRSYVKFSRYIAGALSLNVELAE